MLSLFTRNRLSYQAKRDLKVLLPRLNNVYRVNAGGCAMVALSLQTWLKDIHDIDGDIVYLYQYEGSRDYCNLSNNANGSCAHAVLRVGRTYIDSTGMYNGVKALNSRNIIGHVAQKLVVPTSLVLESINYKGHWNTTFDRHDGLAEIHAILNIKTKIKP